MAGILILLLLPVYLILVVGYLVTGRCQIIFKQKRIGKHEVPFYMFKFKTLDDDQNSPGDKVEFAYGRLLRRSSLDELPQLFNIALGQMSFIGPRPLPVAYLPYFSEWHKKRFSVKPGLTGLAQVRGRTSIPWDKKLTLDVYYVENRSLKLDLKILLETIKVVLQSHKNSLQEPGLIEFMSEKDGQNSKN